MLPELQKGASHVRTDPHKGYTPLDKFGSRTQRSILFRPSLRNDDVTSVTSSRRGVRGNGDGYTRHLSQSPSDENYSGQIGDGYTRHLRHYDDDDASSISHFQLHHSRFGGISPRYSLEFGRNQNTLLSGKQGVLRSIIAADYVETDQRSGTEEAAGGYLQPPQWLQDVEPEQRRHESSVDNDDSCRVGNDDVTDQFPTTNVDSDDIETNQRDRMYIGMAATSHSQQSDSGRSVLASHMNRREEPDSRRGAAGGEIQLQQVLQLSLIHI